MLERILDTVFFSSAAVLVALIYFSFRQKIFQAIPFLILAFLGYHFYRATQGDGARVVSAPSVPAPQRAETETSSPPEVELLSSAAPVPRDTLSLDLPPALPPKQLVLKEMAIGPHLDERALKVIGAAEEFRSNVGTLYCVTVLNNPTEAQIIHHVWLYKGKPMWKKQYVVEVSPSYRIYSYKPILQGATGEWAVVVLNDAGEELGRATFDVF